MSDKINSFKEKFRQALTSTVKVISDDYKIPEKKNDDNSNSKNQNFFEIEELSNKNDFLKLRAKADTEALKKKFSNKSIYNKNLPNNASCRLLYNVAERIRYEVLGSKMLKGIEKNLSENYIRKINLKRKDQLKSKEDVPISEAFELYMLKKFHKIRLNPLSSKMLNFWEKDFNDYIDDHIDFLKKNLESQDSYGSKFSEILEKMDIFDTEENDETKNEENKENELENKSNDEEEENDENKEENSEDRESQVSLDGSTNIDDYKIDEELEDSKLYNVDEILFVKEKIDNLQT